MKQIVVMFLFCLGVLHGCSQGVSQKKEQMTGVGGPCEGCEAIYESPVPFEQLNHIDTLADFNEAGPKLEVSGVVYGPDGKPVPDVVLYVYHTNQEGIYPKRGDEKGWGRMHGYIRGWVKTNAAGEYRFYTLRPGAYPGRDNPEHIHITVKEPDKNEYWIDDFMFADDPILRRMSGHQQNRGGNGVLKPVQKNGMLYVERNIYLGKNVPGWRNG
jgi:protocatechuate 3,4-dioxygenase beta subunit